MRIPVKWRVTVCFFACTLSTSASAYFYTGSQLLAICERSESFEDGLCVGAILGYYEMLLALGYSCRNDRQPTRQQIREVVVKYLKNNPAKLSGRAASLSYFALLSASDCKLSQ
jgi:hypothetical protein